MALHETSSFCAPCGFDIVCVAGIECRYTCEVDDNDESELDDWNFDARAGSPAARAWRSFSSEVNQHQVDQHQNALSLNTRPGREDPGLFFGSTVESGKSRFRDAVWFSVLMNAEWSFSLFRDEVSTCNCSTE
jgi:hypothetical protein